MLENYNPEIKPTEPVEPWPVHGGCCAKVKTEVLTDIQGKLSGLDKTRASTGDIVEALQTIKPLVVGVLMFLSMSVGAAVTPMYVPHYKVGGQVMVMTNIQEWAESSGGGSSGDEPEFIAWRDINDSLRAGPHSMVGPRRNVAIGVSAIAFGDEDPTGGNGGATAVGENAIATNIAATAVGTVSAALGPMSSAYGGNAHAEAELALAVGWGSLAEAINSSAIGNGTRTHHGALGATAIGSGAVVGPNATNAVQIGFGTNDDPETLQFMSHKVAFSSDIAATNTVFSNEVLAVSLELFDTNTVAVLNDLAGTVDGIPLEGGAASIGTILLALLAAVAWLKKNKIGAKDVKRVYNAGGTQYIDGDGGVYKADVELGGHWTLKQLNYTYIAKYNGRREVAGNPYYWVTDDGNRYIYYTPETGKISINGNKATPGAPANLNPEHGDDFPGTFIYSNWKAEFTKQQSVFPSEPQDTLAKKSELDGKVGKELSGQTFDMSNDADTKRLLSLVGQALGATVTHTPLE